MPRKDLIQLILMIAGTVGLAALLYFMIAFGWGTH